MSIDSVVNSGRPQPSARAHIMSAIAILLGVVVCFVPAALFGTYVGLHKYRMVCTPETGYGSGCYEGELLFASIGFGAFFIVYATLSLMLTGVYRRNLPRWRKWLPFTVFCVIVLMTVAVIAFSFGTGPRQYP